MTQGRYYIFNLHLLFNTKILHEKVNRNPLFANVVIRSILSTSTSSRFLLQSNRYNSSFAAARATIDNISDKKMFTLILYIEELIAFMLHLNLRKFENGGKWYGNLPRKFPESA